MILSSDLPLAPSHNPSVSNQIEIQQLLHSGEHLYWGGGQGRKPYESQDQLHVKLRLGTITRISNTWKETK